MFDGHQEVQQHQNVYSYLILWKTNGISVNIITKILKQEKSICYKIALNYSIIIFKVCYIIFFKKLVIFYFAVLSSDCFILSESELYIFLIIFVT